MAEQACEGSPPPHHVGAVESSSTAVPMDNERKEINEMKARERSKDVT